jgi:hypothetical protein
MFLYGSQNCPACYANSIEGFEGIESYNKENMPIIDPTSDYSYVQNGNLVCTRLVGENVDVDGFSCSDAFLNWVTAYPVAIELNRPCRSGEEIIVDYSWMGKMHDDFQVEPDLQADLPADSPQGKIKQQQPLRKSPRLQAKSVPAPVCSSNSSRRAKKLAVEAVEESDEVLAPEGVLEEKETEPIADTSSPTALADMSEDVETGAGTDERDARIQEGQYFGRLW